MVRFVCPSCEYVMHTAQYDNYFAKEGKGKCLKCGAIVADSVNHPLNPEWVKKMKTKFDALNTDGEVNKNGYGTLDFGEMSALLLKGNPNFSEAELRTIFDGADENGNGTIEFTEFLWYLYGTQNKGKKAAAPRRAAGEACTNKLAPSDACESESGNCPKAPGGSGPHHFKYGKCSYCAMPEGKLVKGSGTFAYEGGKGGCAKGGKCMYYMSKCKKCGKSEF